MAGKKQQRTTFIETQKKDNKALFLIHQCVDSKVFEKIADATTSKDAWDILQKSYGGDAKVKKVKFQALKRQFELLEMKSDESIADYFTRVETLTNQMKNCGSTLNEKEMVEKVLRTLTHKFDHIVVTIEQTKNLSEIKMEDLQSTLEAHELKHGERNHGKEDEQTLFVKFKKNQDEKKKWQNKKGSKKGKESVEDKPESSKKEGGQKTKKDKSTIQCYNCDKYGDYASECKAPKKKKSQNTEEETNVAQDASTSEDDVSFMVTITDETSESMVWYFDTGCSNHMTGNKSILTDFNKCLNTRIKLANGNLFAAEGMGNVMIHRSNGKKAVIEKVLYVPGMKCNLISVGQLLEKGFKAVFEGEALKLFDSQKRLILKTTQIQNKTFKTQKSTSKKACEVDLYVGTSDANAPVTFVDQHQHQENHNEEDASNNVVDNEGNIVHYAMLANTEPLDVKSALKNKRAIDVKWVYKLKQNPEGQVIKHKARLVAKGFLRWSMFHLDVKSAFLNGPLKEDVYVKQPPGFELKGKEDRVLKLYKAFDDKHMLIICLYVDDLLVTGSSLIEIENFKSQMESEFQMTNLGKTYILSRNGALGYSKRNADPRLKLEVEESSDTLDSTMFRRLIGSLRYLCQTRPDISYAVGYCGDKVDRRSTSDYVFKFQNALISRCSKKQPVIALSNCEAEYVVGSLAACQANWLQSLLSEIKRIDNKSAINLAKNHVSHGKSKHIETRFHFLKDQVNKRKLSLEYCSTNDQQADIPTKAVKRDQFLKLRREIGIVSFDSLN
ncbi:hypothetical protein TSUD_122730 [Trifolium subterraneum]|uniref:CCHC-type domain-containing protein n=1 Tax=Trifolium subterraneum TaxID=3900 RepID=A0A2Z6NQW5_TRISU|nr:hypothetical protein TSUD_122730 [Trifolium subterraneum]